MGIKEYVEYHRIDAAKRLLAIPDLEVYVIADAVGFSYVESFVRAFRRMEGCTPGTYRRRLTRVGGDGQGTPPHEQDADGQPNGFV